MHMLVTTRTAILLLAFCFDAPALAQSGGSKQTVENAQRFLEMTLPGKVYRSATMKHAMEAARRKTGGEAHLEGHATISDATAIARCKSRLLHKYPESAEIIYRVRGHIQRQPLLSAFPQLRGELGDPDGLPWSDVLEVETVGSTVYLTLDGVVTRLEMDMGAKSLADRVAYAVEFLRISCDKTSDTGF